MKLILQAIKALFHKVEQLIQETASQLGRRVDRAQTTADKAYKAASDARKVASDARKVAENAGSYELREKLGIVYCAAEIDKSSSTNTARAQVSEDEFNTLFTPGAVLLIYYKNDWSVSQTNYRRITFVNENTGGGKIVDVWQKSTSGAYEKASKISAGLHLFAVAKAQDASMNDNMLILLV